MSTPESIVTDLEHARMLKEAGFPQEACSHYWMQIIVPRLKGEPPCKKFGVYPEVEADDMPFQFIEQKYAAPSAEEILRRFREIPMAEMDIRPWPGYGWRIEHDVPNGRAISNPTLANAASQMYAYLAKNGLLPQA